MICSRNETKSIDRIMALTLTLRYYYLLFYFISIIIIIIIIIILQVMVNHTNLDLKAPFGGYKLSGNAREWGESGLDEFLITKMINMDINEYRKNK